MELLDIYNIGVDELGFLKDEFIFDLINIQNNKTLGIKNNLITKSLFESFLNEILDKISEEERIKIKRMIIIPDDNEDTTGIINLMAFTDLLKAVMLCPDCMLKTMELYFVIGFKRVVTLENLNYYNKNEYSYELNLLQKLYNIPSNHILYASYKEGFRNIKEIINPGGEKLFWHNLQKEWTSVFLIVNYLVKQHFLHEIKEIANKPTVKRTFKILGDKALTKAWLINDMHQGFYFEKDGKLKKIWAKYRSVCHIISAFVYYTEYDSSFSNNTNLSCQNFINNKFLNYISFMRDTLNSIYVPRLKKNLLEGELFTFDYIMPSQEINFHITGLEIELIKKYCV